MGNQQQSENEPVTLGEKKIEQLSRQPIIESFVTVSQDGKWVVHKTIITDIKLAHHMGEGPVLQAIGL